MPDVMVTSPQLSFQNPVCESEVGIRVGKAITNPYTLLFIWPKILPIIRNVTYGENIRAEYFPLSIILSPSICNRHPSRKPTTGGTPGISWYCWILISRVSWSYEKKNCC